MKSRSSAHQLFAQKKDRFGELREAVEGSVSKLDYEAGWRLSRSNGPSEMRMAVT